MPSTTEPAEFLTVEEAAARLRISRPTAYRLVSAGILPAFRIGGSIRVSEDELSAWLAESRTAANDGSRQGQLRAAETPAERRAPDSSPAVEAWQPAGER